MAHSLGLLGSSSLCSGNCFCGLLAGDLVLEHVCLERLHCPLQLHLQLCGLSAQLYDLSRLWQWQSLHGRGCTGLPRCLLLRRRLSLCVGLFLNNKPLLMRREMMQGILKNREICVGAYRVRCMHSESVWFMQPCASTMHHAAPRVCIEDGSIQQTQTIKSAKHILGKLW